MFLYFQKFTQFAGFFIAGYKVSGPFLCSEHVVAMASTSTASCQHSCVKNSHLQGILQEIVEVRMFCLRKTF
jgi:hypothetical protein